MRTSRFAFALISGVAVSACKPAPVDPVASLPVEVRSFLRVDPSLKVRAGTLVLDDPKAGLAVFRVQYGEPQDCPSGCFFLTATGVRAGGQTGWVRALGEPPTSAVFVLAARDSAYFTAAFLDQLKLRDLYAFSDLAFALACASSTSAVLREKLLRENPNFPVPLYCPK